MTKPTRDWLIAVGYVCFIYATLGLVTAPLAWLRAHDLLRWSLALLFVLTMAAVLVIFRRRQTREWWRYAGAAGIFLVYWIISHWVKIPEEQVHFFEYGLVGILFLRALRHHVARPISLWAGAAAVGSIAGWIDEILQGILPNRHYDPRDIFLNVISIVLGLTLAAFLPSKKIPSSSENPSQPRNS